MPFVRVAFEFPDQRKTAPLFGRNGAHAENLVRTHGDAVFLAFAAIAVDHRPEDSGFLRALCYRVIHVFNRSRQSRDSTQSRKENPENEQYQDGLDRRATEFSSRGSNGNRPITCSAVLRALFRDSLRLCVFASRFIRFQALLKFPQIGEEPKKRGACAPLWVLAVTF